MYDYIILRADSLLKRFNLECDKEYLLGALTELNFLSICLHELEASEFVENKINDLKSGTLNKDVFTI